MLPVVLVLLVVTSALAAPGVNLTVRSINDVVPPKHNGDIVSGYFTDQASEIVDGGETNPYIMTVQRILVDISNLSDRRSQALALAQTIALLGSLATGIPGDACIAADLINTFVWAVDTGDRAVLRSAISKFIRSLTTSIDLITQLTVDPNSLRFATGPRGKCNDGGRIYQFEPAWDYIRSNASPGTAALIHEQYCSAKRLYNAFGSQSNNAGAFITAASLPPINRIFEEALEPVAKFVAAISSGNPASAARAAKKALIYAAEN